MDLRFPKRTVGELLLAYFEQGRHDESPRRV